MKLNSVEASLNGIESSLSVMAHESINIRFGHGGKLGRRFRRASTFIKGYRSRTPDMRNKLRVRNSTVVVVSISCIYRRWMWWLRHLP
jgi:hypothetical protein